MLSPTHLNFEYMAWSRMLGDYLSGDSWFIFGNYNTLLSSTNQNSTVLRYGDIPHSLGDIPEISNKNRMRTVLWIERSQSPNIMNLEVSVT